MAIQNPVAIYSAANNQEAFLLKNLLESSGIECGVTEDSMIGGSWIGGTVPSIHTPKVWVDHTKAEAAAEILREIEKKRFERSEYGGAIASDASPISVTCEECGEASIYPAIHQGSVQSCPKCNAFVDIGPFENEGEWWNTAEEEANP